MATATASTAHSEGRALDSEPRYRFATGSMSLRYLKPTPNDRPLDVRAWVTDVQDGRKYTLACSVYSGGVKTLEATVVGSWCTAATAPAGASLSASLLFVYPLCLPRQGPSGRIDAMAFVI